MLRLGNSLLLKSVPSSSTPNGSQPTLLRSNSHIANRSISTKVSVTSKSYFQNTSSHNGLRRSNSPAVSKRYYTSEEASTEKKTKKKITDDKHDHEHDHDHDHEHDHDHDHDHEHEHEGLETKEEGVAAEKTDKENESEKEVEKEAKVEGEKGKEGEKEAKPVEVLPPEKEKTVGELEKHEFQAETRKLLDIVARSLYTDKEVFIRELVSNASDALEKRRHTLLAAGSDATATTLEVNVYADNAKKQIIIQDTGIGMKRDELIKHLGSIGFSGSLEYLKNTKDKDLSHIIGQFGVGFYSSFMVANKVTVYSKSAKENAQGHVWVYDGTGSYKVAPADEVDIGTKIIIELNQDNEKFSQKETLERIIQKYSNFVGFPIKLNGNQVNTIKPLWTLAKNQISDREHKEFYQFIAHAYDTPTFHLHYATDSPINIRALFYVPEKSSENFGMGRAEPGVNLFSRKVLIQERAKALLPDWLRFIKGVVDSEDIPLNLSREHLQDSALIARLNNVLMRRILKWFDEESSKDVEKYNKFVQEFGMFLKEGVLTETMTTIREDIAKLLRFETSKKAKGELISFDDYISRLATGQKEIFYICAPSRALAESSPYFESFKAKDMEVLFLYTNVDEYVMSGLGSYKSKKLISIESEKAAAHIKDVQTDTDASKPKLSGDELKDFMTWMKDTLTPRVTAVKESTRLVDSPAIIVDSESASFRRMMKYIDPQKTPDLPKQQLEINSKHEIILKLNTIRKNKPNMAITVASQVFDNALIAAGLMDDSRAILPRINKLLVSALDSSDDLAEVPKVPIEVGKEKEKKKAKAKPKFEEKESSEEGSASKKKETKKEKKEAKAEATKEESSEAASASANTDADASATSTSAEEKTSPSESGKEEQK